MVDAVRKFGISVQHKIGFVLVSEKTLNNSPNKLSVFIPAILNSTVNVISIVLHVV